MNALAEIIAAMRAHEHARPAAPDERARQRITNQFWREQNQRAPPQVCASFWYPGWAAFLVITKPDVMVQWLPEQLAWQPEPWPLQIMAR